MSHFSALFVVLPAVGFGVTAYVTTVAMRRPSGNIDPALGKAMRDRRLVFLQQAALPAILGFVLWFLTLRLDSSVGPAVDALALGFGLASLGTTVAPSLFYAARLPGLWKAPQGFGRVLTVAVLPETNVLFAFVIGDLLIGRLRDPTSSVAYLVGTSTAVANTLALYAGVALLQGYVARITEGPVDVWFRSSVLRLAAVEVLPVLLLVWQFLLLPSV